MSGPPSNWADATIPGPRASRRIWDADDAELQLLIDLITEHEQQTGRVITVAQLRATLTRPGA